MPLVLLMVVMQFFQQSHQQVADLMAELVVPALAEVMEDKLVEQETLLP